ncbi:hypothetical protein PV326_004945 [Microctonus aethiopoides]|nr:hypothetical protein PV326_004945 [Microctonus aethiopoides]
MPYWDRVYPNVQDEPISGKFVMSPNKRISRETGAMSLDENLFDHEMEYLSALTRNVTRTTAESSHVSDSDGDCSRTNVAASGFTDRPPNRRRSAESANGMMSRVLYELRKMRELLAQNKQQNDRIENTLNKLLRYRRPLARKGTKPAGFPLDSVDKIRRFEEVDDEEYNPVVDYCLWLAGCTPCECANAYVKNLLLDNVLEQVTWHGSHGMLALEGTRLVEAFEVAVIGSIGRLRKINVTSTIGCEEVLKDAVADCRSGIA